MYTVGRILKRSTLRILMSSFLHSLSKNRWGIILMLFASLCTAIGQLLWKLSNADLNGYLVIGFLFYGAGAVLMIVAFRFGSLSVLHPLLSIGYVIAVLLGVFILQEEITSINIVGTLLIMVGATLIGGGDH